MSSRAMACPRGGGRDADPAPKLCEAASGARHSLSLGTCCFIAKSAATVTAGRNLPIETFLTVRKGNLNGISANQIFF